MWPKGRLTARSYNVSVTNLDALGTERGPVVTRDRQILCQGFQRKEYTPTTEDFQAVTPHEVTKTFSVDYEDPRSHVPGTTIVLNLLQQNSVFNRLIFCDRCGRRDTEHKTPEQMAKLGCLIEELEESETSQAGHQSSLNHKEPKIIVLPGPKPARSIPMQDRLPKRPAPILAQDRQLVESPVPTGFQFAGFQRPTYSASQCIVWNPAGLKSASSLMPVGGFGSSFSGLSTFTFESFPGVRLSKAPQHTQVNLPLVPLMLPMEIDMSRNGPFSGMNPRLQEQLMQKALEDHVPSKDKAPPADGEFMQGIKKGFFGGKPKRRKPQAKPSGLEVAIADETQQPRPTKQAASQEDAVPSIDELLAKLDIEEQADGIPSKKSISPSLGGTSGTSAPRSELEDMLVDLESDRSSSGPENKVRKYPRSELEDLLSDVEKDEKEICTVGPKKALQKPPQEVSDGDDDMPLLQSTSAKAQHSESGRRFEPPSRQPMALETSTAIQGASKPRRRGFSAMLSSKGLSVQSSVESKEEQRQPQEGFIEIVEAVPEENKNRPKCFSDIWAG